MDRPGSENCVSGGCLCGAVRFEIDLPTQFCAHCHCSMCRRNHGAGYVTWIGVAPGQLRVVAGEQELVRYRSSEHGERKFCGVCGTSLFCANSQFPERVDIPLANLEGAIDKSPQAHIFFTDRASWVVLGDSLPHLGGPTGYEPL
jgi:hypothetical protein